MAVCAASKPVAAPPPVNEKNELPVVYPATDVIPRGERALRRLREIRDQLDGDTSVNVVESALPSFAQQLDEWWKSDGPTLHQGRSAQRVNDLLWEWSLLEARVNSWNTLLASSSKAWTDEEQALGRLVANWHATQSALSKTAPPAVHEKIDAVLRAADAIRELLTNKSERLIAAQGRLAASQQALSEIHQQFDAIRQQSGFNLWSLDSPPLWVVLWSTEAGRSIATQTSESTVKFYREADRFYQFFRNRLLFHLLLFGLLLSLFALLRKLARKSSAIEPSSAELFILDHSYSSALLLAIVAVPFVYPDVSPQILRLSIIPGLIPVLRLSPAILGSRPRLGLYFFIAIYLLDFIRNYLPATWLLSRLLLLSVAGCGAVGIHLLGRASRRAVPVLQAPKQATPLLLRTGLLLFVGSLAANVVGNLVVAEVLVSPLVRVLFVGIAIRLGAIVATTFALMTLRTPAALFSRMVQDRGEAVAVYLRRLVNLMAMGLWVYFALINFGLLPDLLNALDRLLRLEWQVGAAVVSMRDVGNFALVLVAAYLLSRLLRVLLADEIFPRFQMPRGVPDALELLARYGVLLCGFLLALTSAGVNLSQVTLALSAVGVGIGFGLQNVVNNFVSGLILVFEHPIQVGDFVEVGSHFGRVRRIGFRASLVRTLDGAEVIVPNAELIGTKVINWSLSDQLRRLTIQIPIPIGTDPDRVIAILLAVARQQPNVLADPAPVAALDQFGDSALKFVLRCWIQGANFAVVRNALTLAIDKALRDAAIAIPFPQSEVHLHWPVNAGDESA